MFKYLGKAVDVKTGANVIYCQTTPEKYLKIIGDDFQDFELQRKKESHKGYQRLKNDIKDGALLPSITLSVKHNLVNNIVENLNDEEKISEFLSSEDGIVDILDGLQRTFILKEIEKEIGEFKEGQTLLLEYWLESDLRNIVYRMIVLNSGQKAMSMRHQIDLLFATTKITIQEKIPEIEIFTEREGKKRTSSNKYQLNNIASAYYSFLMASPEQDNEKIVSEQIKNNEIFESSKEKINNDFDLFIDIFKSYQEIDSLFWDLYSNLDDELLKDKYNWFGSDNVMLSFFAAAGLLAKNNKVENIKKSLDFLKKDLLKCIYDDDKYDYFYLVKYDEIIKSINSRKVNIGSARRKYIFFMFKEYLKGGGEFNFKACWEMSLI